MGHVYLAEHTRLGRKVALKRLKDRVAAEPEAVAQFITEAQAVNRIGHPHIVDITDFCNDEAGVYYLMELLEGRTVAELLRRDGPLSERQVLYIGHQMADALEAAHRADVLHLDIKPSNIFLVTRDGQADYAKLLDFGIARLRDAAGPPEPRNQSMNMGPVTPAFMAPEQATTRPVDHRTDIYSLGAVLYAMLAGRPPFDAQSLAEFVHKHLNVEPTPLTEIEGLPVPVTAPCSRLVMRCLQKRPADRPQSARELRDRLAKVAEASCGILLVSGRPPETAPTRWTWRRMGLMAALAVVLVGAVAGYVALRIGDGDKPWRRNGGGDVDGTTPARPTAPPVETVTLRLVSTPPGAEVFREDGPQRLLGLTPLRVKDLPRVGSLFLRLKLAGYSEMVLRVDLSQGSRAVRAKLVRSPRPVGMARPALSPMVPRTRPGRGGHRMRPRAMQSPPVMDRQLPMVRAMGTDTGSTVDPFDR